MEANIDTQEHGMPDKPVAVRVVFILNALKIALTIGFLGIFTFTDIRIGDIGPTIILYTLIGYVALFAAMVASIRKRSLLGLRLSIALDLLVSVPAKAGIGFAIAAISLLMTFRSTAKAYFNHG